MSKKALGKGLGSIFKDIGSPVLNSESGDFVHEIAVSEMSPNPFQPRREFKDDDLKGLSKSIADKGLLQPIIVRRHNGKYQIITGERRFRAFRLLGYQTIQAYIRKNVSDREMMELSLIENIQRVQLSPIEEARAYLQLVDNFGLSHEDLAKKLRKSRSAISNTLRLLKLDAQVQSLLEEGKITAGHARAILQLPVIDQLAFAKKIVKENLNVRKAEKHRIITPVKPGRDPNLLAFVEKLKYSLGSKVGIKGTSKKGRLEIYYNSQKELQHISRIITEGGSKRGI